MGLGEEAEKRRRERRIGSFLLEGTKIVMEAFAIDQVNFGKSLSKEWMALKITTQLGFRQPKVRGTSVRDGRC